MNLYFIFRIFTPVVLAQLLIQFQRIPVTNLSADLTADKNQTRIIRSIDDSVNDFARDVTPFDDTISITTLLPEIDEVSRIPNKDESVFHYIWNDISWLTSLLVAMIAFAVFFSHHADLRQRLVGARMRIACCAAIYRKTLRLSKKSNAETAAGYVVNLLSNDVSRLDYGFIYVHYAWLMPITAILICYLIWGQVGFASVVGVVGLLLKTLPVQTGLSRLSAKLRMKIAVRTDQRVGIMNEIIQGIQVIKMYAWEKPFSLVVAEARRREIKQIRYASYIRGISLSTMVFTERSTLFITLAACVFMGTPITADRVFSMAQFFNTLQLVAAIYYPMAVSMGAEALVSIKRVENFLLQGERDANTKGLNRHNKVEEKEHPIEIRSLNACWTDDKRKTLEKIDVNVKKGNLLAIIGPVGAGKSSIFQVLLGELPIESGTVDIRGSISYGSQEPWLFPGSVRNNILFGQEFDRKRYEQVVKHCALTTDFEQLPDGDKTLIGERGSSLSGGQRARISLARAVYKKSDIYLLDDPLSAVDAHVGRHLFDEVVGPKGYLAEQNATRILITHQVHFLKEADWIVMIEEVRIFLEVYKR